MEDKGLKGYLLAGLIAVEFLMSFSVLGYIHVEPISLTLVYIPVLIAGCLLGAGEAALIGIIFGLASMWKASAYYISAGDMIFSPVMSGRPAQSILLSVGARVLFGIIIGILYWLVKRGRHPLAGIIVVTSLGRTIHSMIVYMFMGWLFPEAGYNIFSTFDHYFNKEFVLFMIIQDSVVLFCYFLQKSSYIKKFSDHVKLADQLGIGIVHSWKMMIILIIVVFWASFSVAWYFIQRIGTVMSWHGVHISEGITYDIVHLQFQFLFGIIALFVIVILIIVLYLKNFNYLYYEAKMDGLTGLISRNQFVLLARNILKHMETGKNGRTGFFLILDIDNFKVINDRYGHPVGDLVLSSMAERLKKVLVNKGIVGRLGGDEFVALIYRPVGELEIRFLLEQIKKEISRIDVGCGKITASYGVVRVRGGCTLEFLYDRADRLLYEAKKKGKNQYVMEGAGEKEIF